MAKKKKPDIEFIHQIKIYIKYRYFRLSLLIILIVYLFFISFDLIQIEKETLFWFFSTISQSMAALFAVVGMFAIFRIQAIEIKLIDYGNALKHKFKSPYWRDRFDELDVDCWRHSDILKKAKGQLKIAEERHKRGDFPSPIIRDLKDRITQISLTEKSRTVLSYSLLIPMATILITFITSICCLPLSAAFSINFSRFVILLIIIILITFSSVSLYRFFKFSMNPKWRKI